MNILAILTGLIGKLVKGIGVKGWAGIGAGLGLVVLGYGAANFAVQYGYNKCKSEIAVAPTVTKTTIDSESVPFPTITPPPVKADTVWREDPNVVAERDWAMRQVDSMEAAGLSKDSLIARLRDPKTAIVSFNTEASTKDGFLIFISGEVREKFTPMANHARGEFSPTIAINPVIIPSKKTETDHYVPVGQHFLDVSFRAQLSGQWGRPFFERNGWLVDAGVKVNIGQFHLGLYPLGIVSIPTKEYEYLVHSAVLEFVPTQ